jgi:hypothetical protein
LAAPDHAALLPSTFPLRSTLRRIRERARGLVHRIGIGLGRDQPGPGGGGLEVGARRRGLNRCGAQEVQYELPPAHSVTLSAGLRSAQQYADPEVSSHVRYARVR